MPRIITALFALLLMTAGLTVNAEQSKTFGDYTIHYAAFTTDMLSTEVARQYKIRRSKNRAILNISVLKKVMETTGQPVKAQVEATATNLSRQLKNLTTRELQGNGAIYYIAETAVNNEETLDFNLSITPEGESVALSFSFQQQFFTD
ncbi:MAG: DUF4426 domain-containing protein [Gammaproteobacteria bacterium]|nr:DUF4426 domain-containing protein [Gammaproteobacteria bacterium]